MDGLTTRRPDGKIETNRREYSDFHMGVIDCVHVNDRYDIRLADYEDTGLMPKDVADLEAQLAQAKADNAAKDEALHWVIDFMSREADKYPPGSILWHCSQHIRKTCGEALRTHPGADLLRELEQYKASDASKEQYIAEIYSRAREAERELATHKKALEIACNAFKKPQEYYIELTKEALADGSIRE